MYTLIEEGETFGASTNSTVLKRKFSQIFGAMPLKSTTMQLSCGCVKLTFMGACIVTLTPGLVISTAGYLHLKNSETGAEDWLNLPSNQVVARHLECPMIIGADIFQQTKLRDTIQFLSDTVLTRFAYSAELGE